MNRIIRYRYLTKEEADKYDDIRKQTMKEFHPNKIDSGLGGPESYIVVSRYKKPDCCGCWSSYSLVVSSLGKLLSYAYQFHSRNV